MDRRWKGKDGENGVMLLVSLQVGGFKWEVCKIM